MFMRNLPEAYKISRVFQHWKLFCSTGHSLTANDKSKKIRSVAREIYWKGRYRK